MKLLTQWSHWLPNIIFIEVGIIVIVGGVLLALVTWRVTRRWWKRAPTFTEVSGYHDLPSAESYLDDWTMTKPVAVEPDPQTEPSQDKTENVVKQEIYKKIETIPISDTPVSRGEEEFRAEVGESLNVIKEEVDPQTQFVGEEIEGVIKTFIHVKKDLKRKNDEISELSKRLVRQQTASKMAVKEKLMAIRKAEFEKRGLEQEVRSIEVERDKAHEKMRQNDLERFAETKVIAEKITGFRPAEDKEAKVQTKKSSSRLNIANFAKKLKLDSIFRTKTPNQNIDEISELSKRLAQQQAVSKMAVEEKLTAIRNAEYEKRILEQEVRSVEMERDRAHEKMRQSDLERFAETKVIAEKITGFKPAEDKEAKVQSIKGASKLNIANFAKKLKFKPIFRFKTLKRRPAPTIEERKFDVKFSNVGEAKSEPPVPIVIQKPVTALKTYSEPAVPSITPQDGRKIISVTVPPELMS